MLASAETGLDVAGLQGLVQEVSTGSRAVNRMRT